jgi:hypothetical protein
VAGSGRALGDAELEITGWTEIIENRLTWRPDVGDHVIP